MAGDSGRRNKDPITPARSSFQAKLTHTNTSLLIMVISFGEICSCIPDPVGNSHLDTSRV